MLRIIDLNLKLHEVPVVSKNPTIVLFNGFEQKLKDIKYVAKTASKKRTWYEESLALLEG